MLLIPRKLAETLIDIAYAGLPMEVCGLLAGSSGVVSSITPITNRATIGAHFTMDPGEQLGALQEMQKNGLEILAIYHSHPESPAYPSPEDLRLPLSHDISHVIISLKKLDNPVLKSFKIKKEHIEPENIEYL
jgi:[CysO sulfur-carrier protein]-S-L-cysteine hydrolase